MTRTAMLAAFVVIGGASAVFLAIRNSAEQDLVQPVRYAVTQSYFGGLKHGPAVAQGWWSMYLQRDWQAKVAFRGHDWGKVAAQPASPPLASMAAR